MIKNITHARLFVLDHAEALDFYVGKLGFEVSADVDMGFMRWLTVHPPADPDTHIILEIPAGFAVGEDAVEQVRDLVTKGALGTVFFGVDDCRKTYEELKAKGVEISQEPTEHFYGIDMGIRDPFGNGFRVIEPAPDPMVVPDTFEAPEGMGAERT